LMFPCRDNRALDAPVPNAWQAMQRELICARGRAGTPSQPKQNPAEWPGRGPWTPQPLRARRCSRGSSPPIPSPPLSSVHRM
jgi:hypothetical protein